MNSIWEEHWEEVGWRIILFDARNTLKNEQGGHALACPAHMEGWYPV